MSRSVAFGAALPKGWSKRVRSAAVHAMSLAHSILTETRGLAAHHWNVRVRLRAEVDRLRQEVGLLEEEIRIKDARILRIPGQERPHYPPIERLAILELRAIRGWSLNQTAHRLHLSPVTVSSWLQRANESGPRAIIQVPVPVNKFPEFVAYIVKRLRVLCPSLGYGKIAQLLCRAGLHLGPTTVKRMLRRAIEPEEPRKGRKGAGRRVIAQYRNHVWHADLTAVPISFGLSRSFVPFSLPQRWPFCWWVAVVADQFSRRIMGIAVFTQLPTSEAMRQFLARTVRRAKARPRYFVTDQGLQFRGRPFRTWCKRHRIRQRFGAIGQYGSIAVIERLIQTMKNDCTRRLLVPFRKTALQKELGLFCDWYNRERPHERLVGATPEEVYTAISPACTRPRFEPRRKWPIRSPCAAPHAKVEGRRGA